MTFSVTGTILSLIVQALNLSGPSGLLLLFLLMIVESFGIPPLPSEVILPVSGFLIAEGLNPFFTWPSVMTAAVGGALLGSLLGYTLGRRFGLLFILRVGRRVGFDEKDLDRAQAYFARRGPITVFLARLAPIVRAYISYPAGAAKMDPTRFSVYTLAGSIPFTAVLVYVGYDLHQNLSYFDGVYAVLDYVALAGIVVALAFLWYRAHGRAARAAAPKDPEPAPRDTTTPESR